MRRGGAPLRRVAVEEFGRGPYETALEEGELLVAVHVPAPAPGSALAHQKMSFHERPAITVAVERHGGRRQGARGAPGGRVGRRDARSARAAPSRRWSGSTRWHRAPSSSTRCGEAAAQEAEPVADSNGSVIYKRQLVRVVTRRCVSEALAAAAPR